MDFYSKSANFAISLLTCEVMQRFLSHMASFYLRRSQKIVIGCNITLKKSNAVLMQGDSV
ncbi:hypothetical protein CQA66_05630 [Helicobacter aurati]|uniref:Uncharacterized protein n=1 Tax=Helicobacter aurati TaxID=137778 RepID=A0A3D8J334_9HELI|nr:hypothetical protein CQA66_05630 [Helicobacter aurati]